MKQVFFLLIISLVSITPLLSQDNIHMDIRSAYTGKAFIESELLTPGDSCTVVNPERHDGYVHANAYTLFYDSSRMVMSFHPQLFPWFYNKVCIGMTAIGGLASFNYYIVMYDSTAAGPGALLYISPVQTAVNIPSYPAMSWYSTVIAPPVVTSSMKSAFIGIRYDNAPATGCYLSIDESGSTAQWTGFYSNSSTLPPVWQQILSVPSYSNYKSMALRTEGVQIQGIEREGTEVPAGYMLKQNYPNPFNPSTQINFAVPGAGFIKLAVYDITGRELEVLANENVPAGYYHVKFDASAYTSGVYFYRLVSERFTDVKKMVLIK